MKRRIAPVLVVLALLFAAAAPAASAQEARPARPEEVAESYLKASFAGDWARGASLMHPEALAELKSFFTPLLKQEGAEPSRRLIFKVRTAAEVEGLTGAAFFERLLKFFEENIPGYAVTLRSSEAAVVGTVAEGAELVHVVYRVRVKGTARTKLDVMTVRRDGADWRVMPSADLESLAAALALKVEGDSQAPPPGRTPPPPPRRRP